MPEKPPHRPRGRPRLAPEQRRATVSVSMPGALYDQACAVAHRHEVSLAELARRSIARAVRTDDRREE